MNVDQFTEKATQMLTMKLKEFNEVWNRGQREAPKNWPAELSEADWYEQFFQGFMNQ